MIERIKAAMRRLIRKYVGCGGVVQVTPPDDHVPNVDIDQSEVCICSGCEKYKPQDLHNNCPISMELLVMEAKHKLLIKPVACQRKLETK